MAYDFSGYATKNDLRCGDGRTIKRDAFKECDGTTVPLVWQHVHNEFGNVLGHVLLENREDGVYCYGSFNDTPEGQAAKEYVKHGDIKSLSIYANKLVQKGHDVVHGMIREVSLVLAGANPGAMIDNISIAHSDGTYDTIDDEAIIYSDIDISCCDEDVSHSDEENNDEIVHEDKGETGMAEGNKTVQDVLDSMTDEQKDAMIYVTGLAIEEALKQAGVDTDTDEAKHDDLGDDEMKYNVFDQNRDDRKEDVLSHAEMDEIFSEAISQKASLKETFLAHGITNIDYLFPNTKLLNKEPQIINDDQSWVSIVMNGVHKSPFSRLKTIAADITIEEARAVGYIKGNKKVEEQFGLLKREVSPKTITKLQKFDRDDLLDITDLDVVAWVKSEMQIKLREEIARAILVGDGRPNSNPNKIDEDKVIPIYKDVSPLTGYDSKINGHNVSSATFAIRRTIEVPSNATAADKAELLIDDAVRARVDYKGSGSPTLFIGPAALAEMLLIKDSMGRRIYESEASLATAMRVKNIVDVPILDRISRVENEGEENEQEFTLAGIIVNLSDYTIGLDKGGETRMFDDFDIDYNKQTYLLETRLSGMLTKPYSAIILEYTPASSEG
jgi:HK97 family phage prohead protease